MSEDSSPGGVTPPSDPTSKRTPMKIDLKTVAIGVLTVLGALGYGGVIPPASAPAATPCAVDSSFQSDVRTSLKEMASAQSDMRERMARVEAVLGAQSPSAR